MQTIKQIPRKALSFAVEDVQVGTNGENAKTAPVKLVARSGEPIEHWYWGRVVHDLAGMKLNKPRLPIDYCHEDDAVIGYLSNFDTSTGDLVCSGALIPYSADPSDKATEVIYKAQQGIPYEASINFGGDGIVVEQVPAGASVQVNGYQFDGPGAVIRQWPLRGVAICPYGADANTETSVEMSDSDKPINVTLLSQETETMNEQKTQTEGETKPVEAEKPADTVSADSAADATQQPEEAAALAQPAVESAPAPKPHEKFVALFGDKGARMFLDGVDYNQAIESELKSVREQLAAAQAEIAQLKSKPSRGNPAATFSPEGDKKPASSRDAIKGLISLRK